MSDFEELEISVFEEPSQRLITNHEVDIELLEQLKKKDDYGMKVVEIVCTTSELNCIEGRESESLEAGQQRVDDLQLHSEYKKLTFLRQDPYIS